MLPLIFFKDKESLISKLDLVIITIPIKIGNKVFIILGFNNITIPTSNSIIPKDKNPEIIEVLFFSIIKYTPFIIKIAAIMYVIVSKDVFGNIINI